MTTTAQARCESCGYLAGRCECPGGPQLPAPPPSLLDGYKDLMLPSEVAQVFRVDTKTVTKWAQAGKLDSIRTLGGHRRYRKADIEAALNGGQS